jgi:hypothetical protein
VAQGISAGIALPKNNAHIACVEPIKPILANLKIEVFLVQPEGKQVEVLGNWKSDLT